MFKKVIPKLICILLLTSCLGSFGYSQEKENINNLDFWLKIKPLESTREDLRDLYGVGFIGNFKHVVDYNASFGTVFVVYSMGDCSGVDNKVKVPEWTVLKISYSPNNEKPNLKVLLKGMGKYKSRAEHAYGDVTFYNEEMGVEITYQTTSEEIDNISISPTKDLLEKYSCKEENKNKRIKNYL
jgi:hypothetical protein